MKPHIYRTTCYDAGWAYTYWVVTFGDKKFHQSTFEMACNRARMLFVDARRAALEPR